MKMSKQTAVEWLEGQIKDIFYVAEASEMTKKFKSVYDQAKQMEKKQIMEAVYDSMGTNFDPSMGRAELYYKEKYENG